MERDFLLPDVGEGLEDATIVEWHVHEGGTVALNDPLVTIETAKASVELPSPFQGTVVSLGAQPGATLRVGEPLCRIDTAEGGAPDTERSAESERRDSDEPPSGSGGEPPSGDDGTVSDAEETASPAILVGYGVHDDHAPARGGRAWRRRARDRETETATVRVPVQDGRTLAKPPTRWLARSLGVDLSAVRATGERGEVTSEDVRAAAGEPEEQRERVGGLGNGRGRPFGAGSPEDPEVEIVPVTGVRARIAERMSRSRSTIPDASCAASADFERLVEVREQLRADATEHDAEQLSAFALVAWLVPFALQHAAILNSTFDAGEAVIRVHRDVHLGIATSTEHGLMVPVVRDAGSRTLIGFAHELSRLVRGAREGTLLPTELIGSTFTITNYGALGLDDGNPVINAPEAAILGVGAIRPQAVVVDGVICARRTGRLTCAFDHRVCDGSDAARFLVRLKALVEQPELALARR